MANNTTINTGGIFLPILAVLFIGLKLTNQIAWSWLWVLSPLWLPLAAAGCCAGDPAGFSGDQCGGGFALVIAK